MNKCAISQIEWNHFKHLIIELIKHQNGTPMHFFKNPFKNNKTLSLFSKKIFCNIFFSLFTSSRRNNLLLHFLREKESGSKHVSNKITTQWFCQMCQTHFYGHFSLLTYRILIITTRLLFFSAKKWSIHFQWLIHKLTPILDFTISI